MSFRFCPPGGTHRHTVHPSPARSLFHANKYRLIPVFRRPKSYTLRQILSVRPTAHPSRRLQGALPAGNPPAGAAGPECRGPFATGRERRRSAAYGLRRSPGHAYPDKKRPQMYEFAPMTAVISVSLFPFGRHRPGKFPGLRPPRAVPGFGPRPDTAQTNGTNNPK